MRVLHVTPYFAPAFTYGGPPRSVLGLCRALQATGCDVTVVTTDAGLDPGVAAALAEARHYEGVPARYLHRGVPRRWFRAPEATAVCQRAVAEADIVHLHGCWNFLTWTAARICWRQARPYVSSPRGMLAPWSFSHGSPLKRLAYYGIERLVQRRAAAVHVTSAEEARQISDLGLKTPIRLIPNGVTTSAMPSADRIRAYRLSLGLPDEARVVIAVGRLHPKKGLELLGPTMADVRKAHPEACLVVVGDGPDTYRRQLHARLAETAGGAHVYFTGFLDGERLQAAYAMAEVFVFPSQSENFGLVVVEALAAGVPAVATRTAPWQILEDEGAGLWVEPSDLAPAISALLADPERAQALGRRGRELIARDFRWDTIAQHMLELYEECRPRVSFS